MFHEISCRCGERRKRFKQDIGEFFVDECCEKAGFDHLGRSKLAEGEVADVTALEQAQIEEVAAHVSLNTPLGEPKTKPSSASFLKSIIGLKPGRGKLRDKNRDELLKMVSEKGIEIKQGVTLTKNELIALLLT